MAILLKTLRFCLKSQQFPAFRTFSAALNSDTTGNQRFRDKTAIVTGSTNGIGLAVAHRLARDGAHVVISSRLKPNVDKALASLHQNGLSNVSGLVCDASVKKDRDELIKHAIEKSPNGIDFLVSNVGIFLTKPILEVTSEEWDHYMHTNLKSHAFLTQEVLPYIKMRGKGAIVYTSSVAAYVTVLMSGIYGLSKTAMIGLTRAAAAQLAPDNIRVNCVVPGLIVTDMAQKAINKDSTRNRYLSKAPLKRIGQPDDVAGVVAFLCSDDASYITAESVIVSGGLHCRI